MTPAEERELQALVYQAFEMRDTPYLLDAVGAIVTWHERRPLLELERRQQRHADLVRLLREVA